MNLSGRQVIDPRERSGVPPRGRLNLVNPATPHRPMSSSPRDGSNDHQRTHLTKGGAVGAHGTRKVWPARAVCSRLMMVEGELRGTSTHPGRHPEEPER